MGAIQAAGDGHALPFAPGEVNAAEFARQHGIEVGAGMRTLAIVES